MSPVTFTPNDVVRIAALAKIPVTKTEETSLAAGFTTTMTVVEKLMELDVSKIPPASHISGLENVFREDIVDESRMFTQEQALSNAKRTYNGHFVVDQVLPGE